MDCYIFHAFLLVIILLFMIVIICYHYIKHRSKQNCIGALAIYKQYNDDLKTVCIKKHTCYYFDDIIKIKDFDFGNVLLDEK